MLRKNFFCRLLRLFIIAKSSVVMHIMIFLAENFNGFVVSNGVDVLAEVTGVLIMPAADFRGNGNKCFLLCIFFPCCIVQLVVQQVVNVRMMTYNYFIEAAVVAANITAHKLSICQRV